MPSGELVQVPVAALHAGDRVLVRPGERVPADGTILGGASEIDESLVTGETLPRAVARRRRRSMPAASIMSGALTLRVTAAGAAHAGRRDRAAAGQGDRARSRAPCGLPTAPRGSMRRSCMPRRR